MIVVHQWIMKEKKKSCKELDSNDVRLIQSYCHTWYFRTTAILKSLIVFILRASKFYSNRQTLNLGLSRPYLTLPRQVALKRQTTLLEASAVGLLEALKNLSTITIREVHFDVTTHNRTQDFWIVNLVASLLTAPNWLSLGFSYIGILIDIV